MTPRSKAPQSRGKALRSHETPETVPIPVPAPKTRQKRLKKNPSRADRCGEACRMLEDAESDCQSVADAVREWLVNQPEDKPFTPPIPEVVAGWRTMLSDAENKVQDARTELENLKDEIDNWKDNMPESLQGGEKYSTLESTSDTLDSAIGQLDDDMPTVDNIDDADANPADWDTFAEEVATVADACSNARSDAENAEFPGMFG